MVLILRNSVSYTRLNISFLHDSFSMQDIIRVLYINSLTISIYKTIKRYIINAHYEYEIKLHRGYNNNIVVSRNDFRA